MPCFEHEKNNSSGRSSKTIFKRAFFLWLLYKKKIRLSLCSFRERERDALRDEIIYYFFFSFLFSI